MANLSSVIKATSSLVKFSKKNVGSPKDEGRKSSAIILSPQSKGTNRQSGSGLVRRDSFDIIKKPAQKSLSKFANISLDENIKQIKVKVIQIDSLLKGTVSLQQRANKIKQRGIEDRKRRRREDELEKTKVPKGDKDLKKLPSIPGMGFLEGIMRFFLNMFLGWFAIKFLEYLPSLIAIVKPLGYAVDGIMNFAGNLLNGLLTFVDWGYKAYQFTRDAIKNFAGEGSLGVFDKFMGALNTFMNLAIIAGMLSTLGGGGSKAKGGSPTRPRPGQGGRPKVTRSGGKPQGRPDFRNPFRERPTVTTGGGRGFRNPFRQGPRVTTGGGGAPRFFNPKGFLSGAKTFGVGLLLDYAMNEFVTKPMEEAVVNRGVSKISSLPPEERRKRIELILAEIKKEKDWQSGGGGIFDKTLKLGGLLGETSSEIKVRQLEETLSRLKAAGYNGGGLVGYAQGGGVITRAGEFVGGITRGLGDVMKRLSFTLPSIPSIVPGSKIGGEEQIQKLFPDPPTAKAASPLQYLSDTSNLFAETDYLGPLFSIVTKSILGSKITGEDYKNIGLGINAWIASGINEKKIKGGLSPAFAEGGIVESVPVAEDISKWAEESSKQLISSKVTESNRELLRNLLLQDKHEHGEKDLEGQMQPEDPSLDVGPGGTVTGGNADFWALVAIASLESGNSQGRADVAQSIYNRLASGIYGGRTIKELIVSGNGRQYQPVGRAVNEFKAISDKQSAINAVMAANKLSPSQAAKFINDTATAIQNKELQESARQFVGGRTDFWAEGLTPPPDGVGYTVRHGHRFGWFVGPAAIAYGKKNPGPASAPQLGDIVVMGGAPGGGPLGSGSVSSVDQFTPIAKKYGLTLTSSYRPGDPGYHGKNRARDYSNDAVGRGTPQQMAFAKELASKYGSSLSQLIYTPLGYGIANKKKVGLDYWGAGTNAQHYHHVHVAYEKGGLTKAGTHLAKIGEKGREFVIDADSTAAIEKTFPGFLNAINKANHDGAIRVLRNYASYESEAIQTVYIPTPIPYYTDMPAGSDGNPTNMGAASSFHDSYEILERLPG